MNHHAKMRMGGEGERYRFLASLQQALAAVRSIVVWILRAWFHSPDEEARWEQR